MINTLKKYWFEFKIESAFDWPPGIGIGCGITAFNYQDAMLIMNEKIFLDGKIPLVVKHIEDVNINDLDRGHVIPNMNAPLKRGVWFPLGYE